MFFPLSFCVAIIQGGYEKAFPSIAKLVCERHWFAVKNLIRRQVVRRSEYGEKFGGKTAAEWATYYGLELLAKEIRYFVSID
jgi:hypothetical protein